MPSHSLDILPRASECKHILQVHSSMKDNLTYVKKRNIYTHIVKGFRENTYFVLAALTCTKFDLNKFITCR